MPDDVYREHRRQALRERKQRDVAKAHEGRMTAAEFARLHQISPFALRRRIRESGYDRRGRQDIPIKDLEKFL